MQAPGIPPGFVVPEPHGPKGRLAQRLVTSRLLAAISLVAMVVGIGGGVGFGFVGRSSGGIMPDGRYAGGLGGTATILALVGIVGLIYFVFCVGFPLAIGPRLDPALGAERLRSVTGSGRPLAYLRGSGRLGRLNNGPDLEVWVYPAGIVFQALLISPRVILMPEIHALRKELGTASRSSRRRVTIDHEGIEIDSPTIIQGPGAEDLQALLVSLTGSPH